MVDKENYDFSCWVIKYDISMANNGKRYQNGSLKDNNNIKVPLLWNHDHFNPGTVLGHALLEHRNEGVYAYCSLADTPNKETVIDLIRDRGSVSLSPYINKVRYEDKRVSYGIIREVSLVLVRVDQDEVYYPVISEEKYL